MVNGEPAGLDRQLAPNDVIEFVPATQGSDAKVRLREVLEVLPEKKVYVNGQEIELAPLLKVNEKKASLEDWLEDGAKIELEETVTLGELIEREKLPEMKEKS